jgi:hypothetical protein
MEDLDSDDPDFEQDETVAQEQARANLCDQEIRRMYSRNNTSAQLHYFIQNTIRYFHPDRRYDECLPSMMTRRRQLVALTDEY